MFQLQVYIVYIQAPFRKHQRPPLWDNLALELQHIDTPLRICDDMNMAQCQSQMNGGQPFDLHEVEYFYNFCDQLGLVNLRCVGPHFTQSNYSKQENKVIRTSSINFLNIILLYMLKSCLPFQVIIAQPLSIYEDSNLRIIFSE